MSRRERSRRSRTDGREVARARRAGCGESVPGAQAARSRSIGALRLGAVASAWVLVGASAVACVHTAPPPVAETPVTAAPPPAISPWPGTLANALRAAELGRFDEAERILTAFSVDHAGTPEGAESDFWRALLKTDPANRGATPRESMAMYDAYLSGGATLPRYAEALLLRRVVEALDSTRTLLATVRASADTREKAREEEIRRLNDVVDRTTAELERIKRRLAKPQ